MLKLSELPRIVQTAQSGAVHYIFLFITMKMFIYGLCQRRTYAPHPAEIGGRGLFYIVDAAKLFKKLGLF